MSNMRHMGFDEFVQALASKQATPGGGSATAMTGTLGMALSNMVGNLTLGKKKYAEHEDEIKQLIHQGKTIIEKLLKLIDEDAAVFKPLAHAYGLSKDNPKQIEFRRQTIEKAAINACSVPLNIMELAFDGLLIHKRMCKIGTVIALSDIGCGVAFLKASLSAARFNVLINLKSITNESFISEAQKKVDELLNKGCQVADDILKQINKNLIK